jgi:hypothetical protein
LLDAVKHTRVVFTLFEAKFLEPREERALPSTASLSHTVDGLDNFANETLPVFVETLITLGRMTVDHFSLLEFTLKVSGHEIPTMEP